MTLSSRIGRTTLPEIPAHTFGTSGTLTLATRSAIGMAGIFSLSKLAPHAALNQLPSHKFETNKHMACIMPFISKCRLPHGVRISLNRHRFELCHFWTLVVPSMNVTCLSKGTHLHFKRCTSASLTGNEVWT